MNIDELKKRCGYSGKPQQWQYGFDLAVRELSKAQAVPDNHVMVPQKPTGEMLEALSSHVNCFDGDCWLDSEEAYQAMIKASKSGANQ